MWLRQSTEINTATIIVPRGPEAPSITARGFIGGRDRESLGIGRRNVALEANDVKVREHVRPLRVQRNAFLAWRKFFSLALRHMRQQSVDQRWEFVGDL